MAVSDIDALLVVDVQNDFYPGGALPVSAAHDTTRYVNELICAFSAAGLPVIATQDCHPAEHRSFASQHPGVEVGDTFMLSGYPQVAWPDHCVQGTQGCDFQPEIRSDLFDHVIRKGCDKTIDSYSAFFDNARLHETGLHALLQQLGVSSLAVCGLATDYCVLMSALDAVELGYRVTVAADATAAVNTHPTDYQRALDEMEENGCAVMRTAELLG